MFGERKGYWRIVSRKEQTEEKVLGNLNKEHWIVWFLRIFSNEDQLTLNLFTKVT